MDVEVIIQKLVELGWLRLGRITGNYQIVYCPFHNDGKEKKPSCGILLKEEFRGGQRYPAGFWHCFACSFAGTMQEAIAKLLEIHSVNSSAIQWLEENIPGFVANLDFEYLIPPNMMEAVQAKYTVNQIKESLNSKPTYISEEELASYRFVIPYMYERKLTDKVIEDYDIGYDANFIPPGRSKPVPCITFPVRDINGNTLFFCRRSVKGKYYNYPTGVTKPLFGIDRIPKNCRSLVICESCINSLTSIVYGRPAVALMGTGNSFQINQLRHLGIQEFVICTDGDEAGRKAAQKLKNALSDIAFVWTINMPDGKDLNDCSKEEYDELYDNKE